MKVDTQNAAKLLGVTYRTVLIWVHCGKIKSARRASGARQAPWKYDRDEIVSLKNASR